MSSSSKSKAIADLLQAATDRWFYWDEILEAMIEGFSMVPARIQADIYEAYDTYIPATRTEIADRGLYLMRDGKGRETRWKIATDAPEDRPYIDRCLAKQQKRANGCAKRVNDSIKNLKDGKILPDGWKKTDLLKRPDPGPEKVEQINQPVPSPETT